MEARSLPRFAAMIDFIDSVFHDLNIGLFIYHAEDPADVSSLRLIYANEQASRYTGTDLRGRIGQRLFEAFPELPGTRAPAVFAEVMTTREPRLVGIVDYADQSVRRGSYRTRAFPMPSDCIGVIFENVSPGGAPGEPTAG